jgi:hypothetical protein
MYWKGADINRFYVKQRTERWCRPNYRDFIRPGEVVRLNQKIFSTAPKLLFRQTADEIIACLDERGIWFGRSLIAAVPKSFLTDDQILFLLAVFNSRVVSEAYRRDSCEEGRVFAQVKKAKLEAILVPDPRQASRETVREIASCVRKLLKLLSQADGNSSQERINGILGLLEEKVAAILGGE